MRFASGLAAATLLLMMSLCGGAQTHAAGVPQTAQAHPWGLTLLPAAASGDDMMLLSCVFAATSGEQQKQTVEIRFSVARQVVEVGPDREIFAAQITDAAITFMVGNTAQESLYFSINRRTGSLSVSGTFSVLDTGRCQPAAGQSAKARGTT